MQIEFERCDAHHDDRGDLIQFVTDSFLKKNSLPFGQIYLLTFDRVGVIRGNHYHDHSSEVFCLISGAVEIICENVDTKERVQKTLTIDQGQYFRIFIGPRIAHAIKSLSDFAVMVSYSSEEYSASDTDKQKYLLIS